MVDVVCLWVFCNDVLVSLLQLVITCPSFWLLLLTTEKTLRPWHTLSLNTTQCIVHYRRVRRSVRPVTSLPSSVTRLSLWARTVGRTCNLQRMHHLKSNPRPGVHFTLILHTSASLRAERVAGVVLWKLGIDLQELGACRTIINTLRRVYKSQYAVWK